MRHLEISQFMELIADMPDCEAVIEIEARRATLSQELEKCQAKRIGAPNTGSDQLLERMAVIRQDLTALNLEKRRISEREHRTGVKAGVIELFGQEAYERLLVWVEQQKVSYKPARGN